MDKQPRKLDGEERLALAQRVFQEFRSRCFWSYRPDLRVTEAEIPFIIRELRRNGGHKGYKVAAQLCR